MSLPTVDVAEAAERIAGGAVVLDVRQPEEYVTGHIDGARLVPLGELAGRLDEVPTSAPVVVVCRSGGRSSIATDLLVGVGIDAWNLSGGMDAWAAAERPIATA